MAAGATQSIMRLVHSRPHYYDHLRPVWEALPAWAKDPADGIVMCAAFDDVPKTNDPFVYVEHGAGQSYVGLTADGHYSGGRGFQNCIGFVCPNVETAARWQHRYPDTPSAAIGCPKLDDWHAGLRGAPEERTVAVTFHWDALFTGVRETASLFGLYSDCLWELIHGWRRAGWRVLGHWHPRYPAVGELWEKFNREMGVEVVREAATVLDRASILVADNTSLQAEMMSLGRGIVWLNDNGCTAWGDASSRHGGRFYDWPNQTGVQVGSPEDLMALDLTSVRPSDWHPYSFVDGRASVRASLAIQMWLRDRMTENGG